MVWSLNYIENAATKRRVVMYRGKIADPNASNYDPPATGVHLCGQTDDGEQPTTVAAYPMPARMARELWAVAREVAACPEGEEDFVVDLMVGGLSGPEDFFSNRQLWPRAIGAWNNRASSPSVGEGK